MVYVSKISISELIMDVISYIHSKKQKKYMNEESMNERINKLRILEEKYLKTDSSDRALHIYKNSSMMDTCETGINTDIPMNSSSLEEIQLDDKYTCIICMDKIGDLECKLNCGHSYHYECIKEWAYTRRNNSSPQCRRAIIDLSLIHI